MITIEPCCCQKQLCTLRDTIASGGTKDIRGFGDMSITELLPALLTRYAETRLLIMAPSLPDQAAEAVSKWMKRQWARADGNGKMDVVSSLTIIADFGEEVSPMASLWLKDNPFPGRLTLVERKQEDTVILLPDIAVIGPVNLRYGHDFTAVVTTEKQRVKGLWENLGPKDEPGGSGPKDEPKEDTPADGQTPESDPLPPEESQGYMKEEVKESSAPEAGRARSRRRR